MREIALGDAEATLSSVVGNAARGESFVITRDGRKEAVVIGMDEWTRLSAPPSFGRLLMSSGLAEGDLPPRDRKPWRPADA